MHASTGAHRDARESIQAPSQASRHAGSRVGSDSLRPVSIPDQYAKRSCLRQGTGVSARFEAITSARTDRVHDLRLKPLKVLVVRRDLRREHALDVEVLLSRAALEARDEANCVVREVLRQRREPGGRHVLAFGHDGQREVHGRVVVREERRLGLLLLARTPALTHRWRDNLLDAAVVLFVVGVGIVVDTDTWRRILVNLSQAQGDGRALSIRVAIEHRQLGDVVGFRRNSPDIGKEIDRTVGLSRCDAKAARARDVSHSAQADTFRERSSAFHLGRCSVNLSSDA